VVDYIQQHFAYAFPVFFVVMWLVTTVLLGFWSGWYRLMRLYPDRDDPALVKLRMVSGNMGGGPLGSVNMKGILNLDGCATGLRIGIFRPFGPLCRNVFVPWKEIRTQTEKVLFFDMAVLQLGTPQVSKLSISMDAARQIEAAVPDAWTRGVSSAQAAPLILESRQEVRSAVLKQFALSAVGGAAFFTIGAHLMWNPCPFPLAVLIGLPVAVAGANALIQYGVRGGGRPNA
jgi:hypothetical protein